MRHRIALRSGGEGETERMGEIAALAGRAMPCVTAAHGAYGTTAWITTRKAARIGRAGDVAIHRLD